MMKPRMWWQTRKDKGNAYMRTLVQASAMLYNEHHISCKKEHTAYSLTHRALCARSPPKQKKPNGLTSIEFRLLFALVDRKQNQPTRACLSYTL